MLLSAVALPVAAGDTASSVTAHFCDYDNILTDSAVTACIKTSETLGTAEVKNYMVDNQVSGRKSFEQSYVFTMNSTASENGYLKFSDDKPAVAMLGFSAYSTGSNRFYVQGFYEDTSSQGQWFTMPIDMCESTLKAANSTINTSFERGWHDYCIAFAKTWYRVFVDGKLVCESSLQTTMKAFCYAYVRVDRTKTDPTVAFDDAFLCTATETTAFQTTPTGKENVSSNATSYNVNMGQKVFLQKGSTLTRIADAVKIYEVEGSNETELTGVTKSWNNDTWKDVITLSDLSLKSDATYKVTFDGLTDAFGAEINSSVTFETEKSYDVTASCDNNKGKVTITDENDNPITKATAGTKVKLSVAEKDGYMFTKWSSSDVSLTANSFKEGGAVSNPLVITMPEKNVNVTAEFMETKTNEFALDFENESWTSDSETVTTANDRIAIAKPTGDTSNHGNALQLKCVGDNNGYINAMVQTNRNHVFGISVYVPADSQDAEKTDKNFNFSMNALGTSGAWGGNWNDGKGWDGASPLFDITGQGEILTPTGTYNGSAALATVSNNIKPGWRDIAIATDFDNKSVTVYMDGAKLSSCVITNLRGWNYFNANREGNANSPDVYVDNIYCYFMNTNSIATGGETLNYGATDYMVDFGQKVTWAGNAVPVTVRRGATTIGATATVERDVTSDKVKLTFDTALTDGTYTVDFAGVTDLFGNALNDTNLTDFTVAPEDATLVNVKFIASEGGKIKTTVGTGENAKTITAANHSMFLTAGAEVTVEAVADAGYVMGGAWTGLEKVNVTTATKNSDDGTVDCTAYLTSLSFTVGENDADIGMKFYKLNPVEAYFNNLTNAQELETYRQINTADHFGYGTEYLTVGSGYTIAIKELSVGVNSNRDVVFGFSIYKPETVNAWDMSIKVKADKPYDGLMTGTYATNNNVILKGDLIHIGTASKKLNNGWNGIRIGINFETHTMTLWLNDVYLSTAKMPDSLEYAQRIIITTNHEYRFKQMYLYYPDDAEVSAPKTAETHDTEYIIETGQRIVGANSVKLLKNGTTTVDSSQYTVSTTNDGYRHNIKLTFAEDFLEKDATYTVDVSGVKNAYNNSITTENPSFTVTAKTVKVVAESADSGMGAVKLWDCTNEQNGVEVTSGNSFAEKSRMYATPISDANYEFSDWTVMGLTKTEKSEGELNEGEYSIDATNNTLYFVVSHDNDITITANFAAIPSAVTMTATEGGTATATVYVADDKKWTENIENLKMGTRMRVVAQPNAGYRFGGWEVTNGSLTLSDEEKVTNPLFFNVKDSALTMKATFEKCDSNGASTDIPYYYDFENAVGDMAYGLVVSDWSSATASEEQSLMKTTYADDTRGRVLKVGDGTATYINLNKERNSNVVFGFSAYLNSNTTMRLNSQDASGVWQSYTDTEGKGAGNFENFINITGRTVTAKSGTRTLTWNANKYNVTYSSTDESKTFNTDGWHDFAVAFNYKEHKAMIYVDEELFSTVQMGSEFYMTQKFNINGIKNTMFDGLFECYAGDEVKLTGEDNVKHELENYEIKADQPIIVTKVSEMSGNNGAKAILHADGYDDFTVDVAITTNKTETTLKLSELANADKISTEYKLHEDATYTVTFTGITDMLGRELPKYTFKTRPTKPKITLTTSETRTLPQDTITEIELSALNIDNGQSLTVYRNGEIIKTVTVSGVSDEDMKFNAALEVTLAGGENTFEVKWTDVSGTVYSDELNVVARKFEVLSTKVDADFDEKGQSVLNYNEGTTYGYGVAEVVDSVNDEHQNVLKLSNAKPTQENMPKDDEGNEVTFVAPYVNMPPISLNGGIVTLEADYLFETEQAGNALLKVYTGSGWFTGISVTNDTIKYKTHQIPVDKTNWHHVKTIMDLDNRTVTLIVDDSVVALDESESALTGFSYFNQSISQAYGETRTLYMDNVKLCVVGDCYDFNLTGDEGDERVSVNGTVNVNFTQPMNAETLDAITIADESGNAVTVLKRTLSDDGKTYSMTVSNLLNNAPYYVNVPATVKTMTGAGGVYGEKEIWSEKADFSIDTAKIVSETSNAQNREVKIDVKVNGTGTAKIEVYALVGTKLVGVNYADLISGENRVNVTLSNLPVTDDIVYGVTIVDNLQDLNCIDLMWNMKK